MSQKPLQEPAFLILTALAGAPRHGYAVLREVESLSEGRVTLRAATLYDSLERLAGQGLIEVDHEEVVDGRHRRYYRITAGGAARLADEAERMRRNATVARRALRHLGVQATLAGGFPA
jgi:DNA-binding PadR family transcriptional regulator